MGPPLGESGTTDLRPARAYTLPEAVRPRFAEPWGPVLSTPELAEALPKSAVVVAVGDVVSLTLKDLGFTPRFIVVDYKTQRGDEDPKLKQSLGSWGTREIRVKNPAAELTREAWTAVRRAMLLETGGPTRIVVDGEEDMVGLACFLEAPLGTFVVYGVPGKGACLVEVTQELREKLGKLVGQLLAV